MQRFESKGSVTSVTSSSRGHEKRSAPTHMIVQREDDNQMMLLPVTHLVNGSVTKIKLNNTATFKTDLKNRKQERGRIIQLGSEDVCSEQLQVFEMVANIAAKDATSNELHKTKRKEEEKKKHTKIKSITSFDISDNINIDVASQNLNASTRKKIDTSKQKQSKNEKQLETDEDINEQSIHENDEIEIQSSDPTDNYLSTNDTNHDLEKTGSKRKTNSASTNGTRNESQQGARKSSTTQVINSTTANRKNNVEKQSSTIDCLDSQQREQDENMSYHEIMPRFEFLSKRCNELTKENASLQLHCDQLTKENQLLKRTMMPMPDASGRQWFINMGKYFSQKTSDCDIQKYASALKIDDPRDLLACVQGTTSNTVRKIIRYLYPPQKLLTMTGPDVPDSQRKIIREFAECQRGPILDRQFKEAINGVFRSEKSEFKHKIEDRPTHSSNTHKVKCKSRLIDRRSASLNGIMNKNQTLQSNAIDSDKENLNEVSVEENDEI